MRFRTRRSVVFPRRSTVSARTRCCARWPDASGTWRGSRVAAGDRRVFRAAMLHPDESMPSWRPKLTHHGCPSDRIAPTRASSLIPKARAPIAIPAAAMSDPHRRALSLVARNHMNSKCADCRSKGQGRMARTRALHLDGHWALLELMSLDVVCTGASSHPRELHAGDLPLPSLRRMPPAATGPDEVRRRQERTGRLLVSSC